MALFKDDRTCDKLVDVLGNLAGAIKDLGRPDHTTAQRLADHMTECERRYLSFDQKSNERHAENTLRLARQDRLLYGVIAIGLTILASTITVLITALIQTGRIHP